MTYASFDGQATIREFEDFTWPLPVTRGKPGTLVVTAITVTPSGGITLRGYDQATRLPARCLSDVLDITQANTVPGAVQGHVAHAHAALRTAEATIKGGPSS